MLYNVLYNVLYSVLYNVLYNIFDYIQLRSIIFNYVQLYSIIFNVLIDKLPSKPSLKAQVTRGLGRFDAKKVKKKKIK